MPFAHVNGIEIYYEIHGSGQPLVFFHGLGNNISMYRYQTPYFKLKYKVIIPDLRGNGHSEHLNMPISRIIRAQCDDTAAMMDMLGVDKAVVIGVSYGGVIAQSFAVNYPEKVQGLVVCDSFCDTQPKNIKQWFIKIITDMVWVFYLPRSVMAWFIRKRYQKWPSASEVLVDMVMQLRRKEIAMQRLALSRFNITSRLRNVKVPALGIVGERMKTGIDLMRRVTDNIPKSELVIINNSIDPSNLCQPDVFNAIVDEFIEETVLNR